MLNAYDEETYTDAKGNKQSRVVVRFHPNIAPIKAAILPLIKKDEQQVKLSKEIFADLARDIMVEYDEGGAIGKRYRRQDEIGTPYCVTIDHQTLEDNTVTIRDRDTMEQSRIAIDTLKTHITSTIN